MKKAEQYFNIENLTDANNITLQHHINQAIKAHGVMQKDIDYVVKDGEVIIVDAVSYTHLYHGHWRSDRRLDHWRHYPHHD